MADFSALTAAQSAAGQVPYKNIALGNPAETFLNAWGMATNIRLKKSELEGKMAALAVKNRQLELDSQLDRAKFGLALQKADMDASHKGNMYELAAGRLGLANDLFEFKVQNEQGKDASVSGVAQGMADLAAEGITQGHPDYYRRVNEILAANPNLPNTQANQIRKTAGINQNASGREERLRLNDDYSRFVNDIGRRYYGGNTTVQNLDPILNPENLPDATESEASVTDPRTWFAGPKVKKGFKVIQGLDYQGNKKEYVTSMKELNDLKRQWESLDARKQSLPVPVNRPDLGVFPTEPTTLKEKAERALVDPSASPEAKAAAHKYLGY